MKSLNNRDVGEPIPTRKKKQKEVFVIRRSISYIFGFFSALVMLINLGFLIVGLCWQDLLRIIEQGARPPTLINIAILAEAGSTITQDAMAQAHIDLLIAKGFTERYMQHSEKKKEREENRRMLQEAGEANPATSGHNDAGELPVDLVDPAADGTSEVSGTLSDSDGTPLSEETKASDQNILGEQEAEEASDANNDVDSSAEAENQFSDFVVDIDPDDENDQTGNDCECSITEQTAFEYYSQRRAVPYLEVNECCTEGWLLTMFYQNPAHRDAELQIQPDYDEQIERDYSLCSDLAFVVKDFLSYNYKNFPKVRGFVGFESGSICLAPTKYYQVFYEVSEEYKCDLYQSGSFHPKCREWYQQQKQHPDSAVLTDMYRDPVTEQLISSICVSLQSVENEFRGAMCQDIQMIQDYFSNDLADDYRGELSFHSKADYSIKIAPQTLQLDNQLALEHLSKDILKSVEVEPMEPIEKISADYYGQIKINEGVFSFNSTESEEPEVNLSAYDTIQESLRHKFFFIYSKISFDNWDNFIFTNETNPYQFIVFNNYDSLQKLIIMEEHLFITVFRFWLPYLIAASAVYMYICWFIIDKVATNMTTPFLELSQRIRMNVKNIQKRKKNSERLENLGGRQNKINTTEMQVDLLKGYKQRNKETNDLFFNFNSMAKILFVGHASAQSDFSYQAFFNLHAAAELFKGQNNKRGAGSCYMIIGTKLAMQTQETSDKLAMQWTYFRAIQYLKWSENLQQQVIDANKEDYEKSTTDELNTKMTEDTYILAFRQYTRAIISFNFFVKKDEESHLKYHTRENKRRAFMQQYDTSGLDALHYFEKCLKSWPNQGLNNLERRGSVRDEILKMRGTLSSNVDGNSIVTLSKGPGTSPFMKATPVVVPEAKKTIKIVNNDDQNNMYDIEMGPICQNDDDEQQMVHGNGFHSILGRKSFEEHCDEFLLGSNHDDNDIKKQATEQQYKSNPFSPALPDNALERDQNIFSSDSSSSPSSENQSQSNDSGSLSNLSQQRQALDSVEQIGGASDEESALASEHYEIMPSLQPMRVIGGNRHGQLVEAQAMLNGFDDYTLYIKLLIIELKILLMPIYKSLERSKNEHDESNLGAGGQSEYNSAPQESFDESEMFSDESSSFDYNGANFRIRVPTEEDMKSKKSFMTKNRLTLDEKLELYRKIFDCKDTQRRDEIENKDEQDHIEKELKSLGKQVHAYSSKRLTKIKRMGLAKIKKSYLEQNYFYLVGLFKFTLNKKGNWQGEAITHFLKSVCCSNQQVNALSRKTLIKLHDILTLVWQKKFDERDDLQKTLDFVHQNVKWMPRRLSKHIHRKISNNERILTPNKQRQGSNDKNATNIEHQRSSIGGAFQKELAQQQQRQNTDDSWSITSNNVGKTAYLEQYADAQDIQLTLHQQKKVVELTQTLDRLSQNMKWVQIRLSHHVVEQRSICFVLDTYFEHYKHQQLCKELIIETFRQLDDEDFYGLSMRQDKDLAIEDASLDIPLEQKGSNTAIKELILDKLLSQENAHPKKQRSCYMKQNIISALNQSNLLPEKTLIFQELEFTSPIKWVVAFIGNLRGLRNLTNLTNSESQNTNILLVFMTDEMPDRKDLQSMQETLQNICHQGGIIIIRYRETFNYASRSRDQITKAFQRIQSAIAIYPSKNIPIIQEELAL